MKKKLLVTLSLWLMLGVSAYADKRIVIDLSTQTATAYEDGRAVFSGNISTGTAKRPTPTGSFRVLEKDIDHISSSWPKPYGGAKMHYMLRLTNYGIAMHLGFVPNYPASHGCIRLQNGFAQRMYRWAHVGVPVRIVGHAPARVSRSLARRGTLAKKKKSGYPKPYMKRSMAFTGNTQRQSGVRSSSVTSTQVPKPLDMLSTSPKIIKKVRHAQKERWRNRTKHKSPRVDPLKVIRF